MNEEPYLVEIKAIQHKEETQMTQTDATATQLALDNEGHQIMQANSTIVPTISPGELDQANQPQHGQKLAELFQENNGKYSTMRAMSFIALIAAIVFGAVTITSDDNDGQFITGTFLVAAFAPKAVQRFAERL